MEKLKSTEEEQTHVRAEQCIAMRSMQVLRASERWCMPQECKVAKQHVWQLQDELEASQLESAQATMNPGSQRSQRRGRRTSVRTSRCEKLDHAMLNLSMLNANAADCWRLRRLGYLGSDLGAVHLPTSPTSQFLSRKNASLQCAFALLQAHCQY